MNERTHARTQIANQSVSGSTNNWLVKFSVATDTGAYPFKSSGNTDVIWAVGYSTAFNGHSDKGALTIDFATGTIGAVANGKAALYIAHGAVGP